MKRKLLITAILVFAGAIIYFSGFHKSEVDKLREKHQAFLDNSPFEETKSLSKKERKARGLPPNAYYEQLWDLTLDPATGRPMPERVDAIQKQLREERLAQRGGGGDNFSPWVDRGPNNIGGRTRAIMFDPNDGDNNRVFAGGVSGGLWVNEDITDPNSSWTMVTGIGANISVTVMISDPNDSNTFYIGSGESYTFGAAVGRGIWKSTDGGVTWSHIFGGYTSADGGQLINGIFYVNDLVARDVGATTELYASIAGAAYNSSQSPTNQFHGLNEQGLYKSVDNGANWTKFTIDEGNGTPSNPNDIELDINNNIWLTTTRSSWSGVTGGKILRSTDGITFTLINTIAGAQRTEIEPSSTDANKFWIAAEVGGANLYVTTDAFATINPMTTEPNDVDQGISSTDYTRGQAFYDLPIESDSNGNVYVGGIDLFRSSNDGGSWEQISKWSNNNDLAALNVSLVHADHHAIVFRPGNENQAVFGNDGGVYFSNDLSSSSISTTAITSRNKDYNVTQFYYGSIASGTGNEIFFGGTQDNGTLISQNSVAGANDFDNYYAFFSGDGSYSEIDQDGGGIPNRGEYIIIGSVRLSYYLAETSHTSTGQVFNNGYTIVSTSEGNFINEAELDHANNILYANSSQGNSNRFSSFVLGENSATRTDFSHSLLDDEPSAFKVSSFTNGTIFVGTQNSEVLKVENIGAFNETWTDISGAGFVGSISDIEIGTSEQEIFVTVHNYGVTSIWYTSDGGTTWENKEGDLPDLPVKCILRNPLLPQEVIIGTELGVWRTSDFTVANPVWTQSYNGMSDVTVLDLDLRSADNTILATTHGRGMFTSVFTSDVASVEEVLTDKKVFTVFPTISDGNFTVYAKNELGNSNIQIFDISGKQVYTSQLNFNENSNQPLSVSLKSGIYIVNVIDQNNRKSSGKIIIK
ncbi:T9SS type A sorting domain-containing protein [Pseudotenacibaculum sp. MALMAid0570]|uniref:T9SS type A sorting domain-containing protein n=1 Tax=Pseudotenacibaculum sp. MALMAid0570 TaxID=3143938 RepID=UPI0032DF5EEE